MRPTRKVLTLLLAWFCCQAALAEEGPVLVIIIDDLGYNFRAGQQAAALPGKVNLAILPHTPNGRHVAKLGMAAGKEILLHAPMSNLRKVPLGEGGLTTAMSEEELRATLARNIDSTPGVRGVNNHTGSLLTSRRQPMEWVMKELAARGLYYVDSRTTAETLAAGVADEYGVPSLSRQVFLDNEISSDAIHEQFEEFLAVARREGMATAIGHPHEATLNYLQRQLPVIERQGYRLSLVSEVLAQKVARTPVVLSTQGAE